MTTDGELECADVRLEPWSLVYDAFDPRSEKQREALCTLGNGRFATRGAASDVLGANEAHYPGTYAAGVYDRLNSEVDGKQVEHEELVNLPNWLPVRFVVDGGTPFTLAEAELLAFRQTLDLADGLLTREMRLVDPHGRRVRICEQRLVHMEHPSLAALRITFEPENWSGPVRVESWLDGQVANTNAKDYQGLDRRHLTQISSQADAPGCCALRARTRQSRVELMLATRTQVSGARTTFAAALEDDRRVGVAFHVETVAGECITVEKVLALATSRDPACSEPSEQALRTLASAPDFAALRDSHVHAWQRRWSRFVLDLPDHARTRTLLRMHAFHLLQTISSASVSLDVSVPARGLHGEAYHGHVFWDDLFIFPFVSLRWYELARALLLYRHRRLPEARRHAATLGLRGACFPWRSASDGREVTERYRRNPLSGRWVEDHSHLQRHIGAAVVYNVWQYLRITNDREFLIERGAEMVLSVAQFWSSAATWDDADQRYHLRGVVGPDEFHEGYPDRDEPGIDDNAYTNIMAVWCLLRAEDVLAMLPEIERASLCVRLGIDETERARWRHLCERMAVHVLDGGVLAQFRGFERLAPLPFEAYRSRYGDIHRIDNILVQEGDTPNRYQVCKQADVLMLFYLLPEHELRALLGQLGYRVQDDFLARNVDYYLARTAHGSTLSRVVHAWVLTRLDRAGSWSVLREALGSDLADIQGGTTGEGVHMGAMAGTIDVFQRAYLGLDVGAERLVLDPCMPAELTSMRVQVRYREHVLDLSVDHTLLHIAAEPGGRAVSVSVRGEPYTITPGKTLTIPLTP